MRISREKIPTKSGFVVTNTTELVTLVYLRELIQNIKCSAKKTDAIRENLISLLSGKPLLIVPLMKKGKSTRNAKVSLIRAIATEGIEMMLVTGPANETEIIPVIITNGRYALFSFNH
ncbi:MAG: hypothetical protein N3B13_00700 [Deltaproteobacteria bacterium]|nr:hypothetical protein [Deltaproteobacteria bacterium]